MNRRPLVAGAIACATLILAAIAAHAQTSVALLPVKIATSPQAATAEAFFAEELGLFRKHGLDAQVVSVGRGAGSAVTTVILGHAADIGESDIIALCAAHEHGIPLTILAPSNAYLTGSPAIHELLVEKSSPIRSAKDLNGKTLSVVSLEGPAKLAVAKWLDDHGADLTTIKFVELPPTTAGASLANGTVAAAMIPEPFLSAALTHARVLADAYKDAYGRPFQLSYWFSTPDWVKSNPDAARRFVETMHETALWTNDPKNAQQYAEILEKVTKIPDEAIQRMNRANYGVTVDVAQAQRLLDAGLKYKSLHEACPAKDLVSPVALTK